MLGGKLGKEVKEAILHSFPEQGTKINWQLQLPQAFKEMPLFKQK